MNAKSLSGDEYFLTFIDDKTHHTWVYILKHKDEVFAQICEWKSMVERTTRTLRTDNGGEYMSTECKSYLGQKEFVMNSWYQRHLNKMVWLEQMNTTLVESVRSMLTDAKLPQKFWAEALSTAVYLRNRSPTVAVPDSTEAWTGDKPNVKHLRVFGCAAYAQIPKDECHKLDPKAWKRILLGYGIETKGYQLYDPK